MEELKKSYDKYLKKKYRVSLKELEEIFEALGFNGQGMFSRQIVRSNVEQVLFVKTLEALGYTASSRIALEWQSDQFSINNIDKVSLFKVMEIRNGIITQKIFPMPSDGEVLKENSVVQEIKRRFSLTTEVIELEIEELASKIFEIISARGKFIPLKIDGEIYKFKKDIEAYVSKQGKTLYLDEIKRVSFPASLAYRLILIPLNLSGRAKQIGIGGVPDTWKFIPPGLTKGVIEKFIIREIPVEILKEEKWFRDLSIKAQKFLGFQDELAGLYVHIDLESQKDQKELERINELARKIAPKISSFF